MIIRTNIPSLNANKNLNDVNSKQAKALQRLSSGLRINSAADDAAGLAISEKMRAQIRGLDQAGSNIQDGASLLNVADGALQEAQDIVQRMRELAVQACNDTNTEDDRRKLNEEYMQLCYELDDIAQNTEFNTRKLFTGEYAEKVFSMLDIDWGGVVETDPRNNATSAAPTMTPRTVGSQASSVGNLYRYGSIVSFPSDTNTPKAVLNVPPRPARDLAGTADDLTGDQGFNSGVINTSNIGGKIVASTGTYELNVSNNTSYKNNMDGSTYTWQGQRQDWIDPQYDSTTGQLIPGTNTWGTPYDDTTTTVGTIEDYSQNGAYGGQAGTPAPRTNTSRILYTWDRIISQVQPNYTGPTAGNTKWDYDHDEWERADIYSEAVKTNVTSNTGGAVYVRNSAAGSETYVGNNVADMKYNFGSVSPPDYPQARVDTDTRKVTVGTNSYQATVVSRSQVADSEFISTTNDGTIYCGAKNTTVTTNTGTLYVDSDENLNPPTNISVTTNSGIVYADSYAAQIGTNYGTIAQLNSGAGSSFTLTGTNSGYVRTDAEIVTVNSNSTYSSLVTTNASANSQLNVTTNTGTIDTSAITVNITTNGGSLRLANTDPNSVATIGSTTANSVIDTFAKQLTINGNANGSIRVENGASVTINGANNAAVSVLSGGTLNVTGNLTGTTTVESGATLTINGDITGTLYIRAGANVSFTGQLKGTIVFLGEPASFSPQPLDVAAGGTVELQNTTKIDIGVNNGTVRTFNSTASIADNKGTLQVNNSSTATVSANSGTILNLGNIVTNSSANTGTVNNWKKINPPFINSGGIINHNLPFATDNGAYDVSGVNFPTVVNGQLVPSVQTAVIKFLQNGQDYTLTAEWKPTINADDMSIRCDCTIGAHDKSGCTDHNLGLVADAFELIFDLDNTVPTLQSGEQFVFLPNTNLNAAGMRYDIAGKTLIYDVDAEVTLTEVWEDNNGLWIHTGANTNQGHNVYLPDMTHSMSDITISCAICDCSTLKSSDLLNYPNATAALGICDMTNNNISKVRGYIGAQINSLMYAGNYAAISSENLSSAESRIRDADIAKEMMANTKNNILSQAGVAMITQSNQNLERVLQLLR